MFSSLWQKLKEMIRNMIGGKTIEQALSITPAISTHMEKSIELWSDMYKNQAPWLREPTIDNPVRVVSLGLPSMIASEKARMAVLEWQSEITEPSVEVELKDLEYENTQEETLDDKTKSNSNVNTNVKQKTNLSNKNSRAVFLNTYYQKLRKQIRKQLEYGIAKGGLVIKPYIQVHKNSKGEETHKTIEFDFIQADYFYPVETNANGDITAAAFIQTKIDNDKIYKRLEYHRYANNQVQVINKAFVSDRTNDVLDNPLGELGKEIPLTDVLGWGDIPQSVIINDIDRPLFAYFKMPDANTVDTTSPLGVSGYSRAISLIKDADMQYSRLLWEYEAGEMAIDVDRDALKFIETGEGTGHSVTPTLQGRLYRKVDIEPNDLFQPYAPTLRSGQYIEGLNTILMRIEDVCGISRGTLSDVLSEARTATELKILKQRSYSVNEEIQHALENTLRDVIYIMDTYCTLYNLTPDGEYDVSFEWDDSIIVDVESELSKRLMLMQYGLSSKIETRMWYFGETERQAKEALERIEEEALEYAENEVDNENRDTKFRGKVND